MSTFQSYIPYDVLSPKSLPGIAPLEPKNWLFVDDAYSDQMALRQDLLANRRQDVLQLDPSGMQAAQELLREVVAYLAKADLGFECNKDEVLCPDQRRVKILEEDPLRTLGVLVQNDFCILQQPSDMTEHILTGAVLCFPANWQLKTKFMHPLTHIHEPVEDYTPDIAKRVQRMFNGIQVGRPLWRSNALWYADPSLYQPGTTGNPRPVGGQAGRYMRSERQTLLRLPLTGAVIFGIHTFMVRSEDLLSPST